MKDGKLVYLPQNTPIYNYDFFFKQECLRYFGNFVQISVRSWCGGLQVLDYNKAKDLWYIFNVLTNDPARFVTLITTAGISVPLYSILDPNSILGFVWKLTFARLLRLYASSFDKSLLSHKWNDRLFLDRNGDRLLIKQPNGLFEFSPKGIQEKITNPRDPRFLEAPLLDDNGKYLNILHYEEINKNVAPGFFTSPMNRFPETTPEELATYMVCLDYMDHMHSQRLQAIKSYGILKQHAPDILENLR